MNINNQKGLDSWDGFLGSNFLSPDDVIDEDAPFFCIRVELDVENDRPLIVVENDKLSYKFSLNVTNSKFISEECNIRSPNSLVGKKIYFRKTMAFSPQAKKEVPTLRISKIE